MANQATTKTAPSRLAGIITQPALARLAQLISRLEQRLGVAAQTTAEYALVLLGAAAIAMLLLAWAGETNRLTTLFDTVLRSVTNLVS